MLQKRILAEALAEEETAKIKAEKQRKLKEKQQKFEENRQREERRKVRDGREAEWLVITVGQVSLRDCSILI